MDRRDFLKVFAASAAFSMVKPLGAMAGEKINRPIRIGFIGTGNRGTYGVITAMSHNNNIELYALADLFRDRIDKVLPHLNNLNKAKGLPNIAEKNIYEYKERILDKKTELEVIKEKMTVRNEDLKAKQEELATIVEATSKEEEKLTKEREACAAKIDARTMSAYDRIRKSNNNHLAVVSVFNNDSCGGCFNTIAPQRLIDIAANKKLIICEYCGRILVNPDFE